MRLKNILAGISKFDTAPYQMRPYEFVDFFPTKRYDADYFKKEKRSFSSVIYKLKKQGFIKAVNKEGTFFWKLTKLGTKKLQKLNEKFIFPKTRYNKEPIDFSIIIAFDIPEKLKHLRSWMRCSLVSIGFEKLQRSLWIGKFKIPEEFIKDIYKLKLNNYIVIFKIVERGLI